jgi:predicted aminopeptidase
MRNDKSARSRGAFALALGCLCACLLPSCYVVGVGTKYLSLQGRAKSVRKLLADPGLPPRTRSFLERTAAIRSFAVGRLGLADSRNYTSLGDSGRGYIADVVQACSRTSFKRYLWSYPLVGKLPYKGFFDSESARKEAQAVEARGYDALVRPVDGFSTLGFLRDPLWTFMEGYPDADLADLLIHELTHATIYKRGHDDFNEEAATFVGEEGALEYLKEAHGPDSPELLAALARRRSTRAFVAFMHETAAELESLYAQGLPEPIVLERKAELLSSRAALYAKAAFEEPGFRDFDFSKVNNAYLDMYRMYWGDGDLYEDYFREACGSDLRVFVASLRRLAKTEKDPKAAMRKALLP